VTRAEPMPSRSLADRFPDLLPLGGHPTADMPPHIVEAAAAAAQRPAYAPIQGSRALREAIAERHAVEPEQVLVTLGGMQALHLAALAFGSRSVVHAPSFFFPQIARAAGGDCALAYDWDEYAAAVTGDTTLAIVNTPVNPSGYVLRGDDLDAVARAVSGTEAVVVSDEAYAGVVYDGVPLLSPASHPDLAPRTVVLRSFSKTFAMAAWRVGYAVGPRDAIVAMTRLHGWQALAIDAVAQAAALAALTGPRAWLDAALAELAEMRPRAIAAANATGPLHADVPEAAAFVWAAVDGDEDAWSERLARDHRLPAVPGRHFGARTPHLRIPFGGPRDARDALLAELARVTTADTS